MGYFQGVRLGWLFGMNLGLVREIVREVDVVTESGREGGKPPP